jgi:starch-binding outer membrane protein, SusD/RagB family
MKSFILSCLGIFLLLVSCTSLDVKPTDFTSPEFYYNTEEDLNFALTGVYDVMGKSALYGHDGLMGGFDVADEFYFVRARGPHIYNYNASDSWLVPLWQTLYTGIERANMLLANIDKANITDAKRQVIKGEAKFLRGFFYFLLVQNFGDVPLKTTPTASVNDVFLTRTSTRAVYDFIYKEMSEAEALVKPTVEFPYAGRATKSAVQGILARVSLFMAGFPNKDTGRFQDALVWAEKVIQSGNHSLNPDYSQVFINLIQDKYDLKESIWEVEFFTTGITDTPEAGVVSISNGIPQQILEYGFATGGMFIQEKLYRSYEANDVRRDWAIAPYSFKNSSTPPLKVYWTDDQIYDRQIGKFRREYELVTDKSKNVTGINFPLLRYSDVLLMAAEAENELNGPTEKAYTYLNLVRSRAKASTYSMALNKFDKVAFRQVIRDERSRELCFEALRRQDLVRWGILVPEMKNMIDYINQTTATATLKTRAALAAQNLTETHLLLAIPSREMSLNKMLVQNPGW